MAEQLESVDVAIKIKKRTINDDDSIIVLLECELKDYTKFGMFRKHIGAWVNHMKGQTVLNLAKDSKK